MIDSYNSLCIIYRVGLLLLQQCEIKQLSTALWLGLFFLLGGGVFCFVVWFGFFN